MPPTTSSLTSPPDRRAALESGVRDGLSTPDKWLSPVWFYDERGSRLFEEITRLEEYYLTRAERLLLEIHANEIATLSPVPTLLELGAGSCEKSRVLLDAMRATGHLKCFVPVDVSESTIRAAAIELSESYPGLRVDAVVADFVTELASIESPRCQLVALLGGTIGNLDGPARARFLFDLDCALDRGDSFLVGTDLVKDPRRLVTAYDDARGVTAAFNRNVLVVLNRELNATFDPDRFAHVAIYDEDRCQIEMRLRSIGRQRVEIRALSMEVEFEDGEELRTEISAKFTRSQVEAELGAAGFVVEEMWDQPGGEFLLTLARPYC